VYDTVLDWYDIVHLAIVAAPKLPHDIANSSG